jgi:hypothetical protein
MPRKPPKPPTRNVKVLDCSSRAKVYTLPILSPDPWKTRAPMTLKAPMALV